MHFPSALRTHTLAGLLFLGAVLCGGAVRAEVPSFVKETIYSPNAAAVAHIVPSLSTDIVVLDGGWRGTAARYGLLGLPRFPSHWRNHYH